MVAVNELRLSSTIVGLKGFQLVSIVQQKKAPNQWLPMKHLFPLGTLSITDLLTKKKLNANKRIVTMEELIKISISWSYHAVTNKHIR